MAGLRFEAPDRFAQRGSEERPLTLCHQPAVAWRMYDDLHSSSSSVPFKAHHGVNGSLHARSNPFDRALCAQTETLGYDGVVCMEDDVHNATSWLRKLALERAVHVGAKLTPPARRERSVDNVITLLC